MEKPPIESADGLCEQPFAPTIPWMLRTLACAWAAMHPYATIEERQFLAALVATELAGR
ncbi:hypothetical protein IFJ82_09815 [Novacetimonas hansenii]|uniref:hypothetical protein n=1 Tax=Novacetimonas hansenii TaxID=436 RepID=UPI000AF2604C|nr:hypothetical protein [Novacetimonas hansenii]QOF94247.1 hypothetical protein IFJ82_09815 [Novacetimonas hansenii]